MKIRLVFSSIHSPTIPSVIHPLPIFHQKLAGVGEFAQCDHIPPVAYFGTHVEYFGSCFGSLDTYVLISARIGGRSQRVARMRMNCVLVEYRLYAETMKFGIGSQHLFDIFMPYNLA